MRFSLECWKYFGFALPRHKIGFKKSAPILHSIRSKTETRTLWLVLTHFNINCTCIYFKFWLVHWIVCALCDCFVIIFVLVFWDSIENQSIVMCLSEQWYFLNHSGFAVSTNKHSQFMACSNCYAVIQFHPWPTCRFNLLKVHSLYNHNKICLNIQNALPADNVQKL